MRLVKVFPYLFLMRFNPRICKRCDKANALATRAIMVSIHASVKDATQFRGFSYKEIIVSIHASVKDATLDLSFLSISETFQSTHL